MGPEVRPGFVAGARFVPGLLHVNNDAPASARCVGITFRHPPRPDHTLVFGVASVKLLVAELDSSEVSAEVLRVARLDPSLFHADQERFREISSTTESPLKPANLFTFAERSLVMSVQTTMAADSVLLTVCIVGGTSFELLLPLVAIPALLAGVEEYFPDNCG